MEGEGVGNSGGEEEKGKEEVVKIGDGRGERGEGKSKRR